MIAFFDGAFAVGTIAFSIGHGTDSLGGGCLGLEGRAVIISVEAVGELGGCGAGGLGVWGHIRCCGNGCLGFRPYGGSLFPDAEKVTKKACPGVRHFAEAQCSLATVSIRGHRLRFASLHLLSMYAATPHGAARLPPDEHLRSACRRGKRSKAEAKSKTGSRARSRAPHPSPLPEGEGTGRGVWESYADMR